MLRNEFNRKGKAHAYGQTGTEAGLAIQAIKPVFMMGPMSIANFLHPGSIEPDLVIFDEASQVRPVEALGALLRGKQLVVVGGTKQLPPTVSSIR
jgi:superfamily I DNA and/or RNA helicase